MKSGVTNFRSLFDGAHRIEIPTIQRDYAQGREDARTVDVRVQFVRDLATAVQVEVTTPRDLDFVYGRWNADTGILEPLDGQQRLTTLFLLHWYIASREGAFDDFRSWVCQPGGGSSFTYRTRPSAREFFDALVEHAPPPDVVQTPSDSAISSWATDAAWFMRSWLRDATVRGCLKMLDEFHRAFATTTNYWQRLVSTTQPPIVFRLLVLENFGLSDDLYVKMNARGKALTSFEVFKAEFEAYVSEAFIDERLPAPSLPPRVDGARAEGPTRWRDYVSIQFDGPWTDLLWHHRGYGSEIDSTFMHLIRASVFVACINESDDTTLQGRVEFLLDTPQPSVRDYREWGCLSPAVVRSDRACGDAQLDERINHSRDRDLPTAPPIPRTPS